MPEIVNEPIDWKESSWIQRPDWSMFSDGKSRRLVAGVDFKDSPEAWRRVRSIAYHHAEARGMVARTKKEDGSIIVQFYKEAGK